MLFTNSFEITSYIARSVIIEQEQDIKPNNKVIVELHRIEVIEKEQIMADEGDLFNAQKILFETSTKMKQWGHHEYEHNKMRVMMNDLSENVKSMVIPILYNEVGKSSLFATTRGYRQHRSAKTSTKSSEKSCAHDTPCESYTSNINQKLMSKEQE